MPGSSSMRVFFGQNLTARIHFTLIQTLTHILAGPALRTGSCKNIAPYVSRFNFSGAQKSKVSNFSNGKTRLGLQCQTPLSSYPLTLDTWPLSFMPYLLPLIPIFCSISPSTVPFKKFRWGLLLSLSLLSKVKERSTPSPRSKTLSLTIRTY